MTYGWRPTIEKILRDQRKKKLQPWEMASDVVTPPLSRDEPLEVPPLRTMGEYTGEWPPSPPPLTKSIPQEYKERWERNPELLLPEVGLLAIGGEAFIAGKAAWQLGGRMIAKKGIEKVGGIALRAAVTPLVPEQAIGAAAKKVLSPVTTALMKRYTALIPEKTVTHTYEQLVKAHGIAKARGITNAQRGTLNKLYTGKASMKDMTRDEAETMIKALSNVIRKPNGKIVIPKKTTAVPAEFMDDIPYLQDLGFHDLFRQKLTILRLKFASFGRKLSDDLLETELQYNKELVLFRETSNNYAKLIGNDPVRKARVFQALEDPLQTHALDPEEQQVFTYFRKYFDEWADRLKLSPELRRKNYITHIFDEQIRQDHVEGKTLAMEFMAAIDWNASPNTFMPFLQKRTGATVGLKTDPFEAANVYEYYALKRNYYEPLARKITSYASVLKDSKPAHWRYLQDMSKRIAGRPTDTDLKINTSLKAVVNKMGKTPLIGKKITERFEALANRGNFGALVAHNMSSIYYQAWLGFRPVSAIRNLSQQLLAAADAGVDNLGKGIALRFTAEGKDALKDSVIYQGRVLTQPFAGLEESALQRMPKNLQNWSLGLFKFADKQNVADSFLAGYSQGKSLGLPREWAIKMGDEVAANTQFIYTKMARSLFEDTTLGRFTTPFTSWPRNFLELLSKWGSGRQSMVVEEYMRQTGKKIALPQNWAGRHQSLMTYAGILAGAYVTEGLTPIKATQYTGWTSIQSLGKMLGGGLPAVKLPGAIAEVVTGITAGDEIAIKSGWNDIRPDRFVQIIKQLEDVTEGKADFLTLFMYLDRYEMEQGDVRPRPKPKPRPRH